MNKEESYLAKQKEIGKKSKERAELEFKAIRWLKASGYELGDDLVWRKGAFVSSLESAIKVIS